MITQIKVKKLFQYKNGNLYWKQSPSLKIKIEDKAGHTRKDGYIIIGINGKLYYSHRLIFLYHYGYIPEFIDHINGNKSNNYIENLREITKSQNGMNSKLTKNTSSQYKGVCWDKNRNKWISKIIFNGKQIYLGRFKSEIKAALTYNIKATELFGEYAYLNQIKSHQDE